MNQQNIEILEAQRPKVEYFFKTGSLMLTITMGSHCERCIDSQALQQIMRDEWEPGATLNPYADWHDDNGYKGFLSRLYAHYDKWKAVQNQHIIA